MDEDIFTLARDKGAVSAVRTLYLLTWRLWLPLSAPLLSIFSSLCYQPPVFRSTILRPSIRHILNPELNKFTSH